MEWPLLCFDCLGTALENRSKICPCIDLLFSSALLSLFGDSRRGTELRDCCAGSPMSC